MDGWMNGWMDEWMGGWMNGQINEWIYERQATWDDTSSLAVFTDGTFQEGGMHGWTWNSSLR